MFKTDELMLSSLQSDVFGVEVKALPLIAKRKLAARTFIQSQYLKVLAASFRVGLPLVEKKLNSCHIIKTTSVEKIRKFLVFGDTCAFHAVVCS